METEVKEKFITIKGKDYPLKQTWQSMIDAEALSKEDNPSAIRYISKLFYIYIKGGGSDMTYEQFMELINDDFSLLGKFNDLMGIGDEKKVTGQ